MIAETDTPLGRFRIDWDAPGGAGAFPAPACVRDGSDLYPARIGGLALPDPVRGGEADLGLHRQRSDQGALLLMGTAPGGPRIRGVRLAPSHDGPPDPVRDAHLMDRPAWNHDPAAWETLASEPWLLQVLRRGDAHGFHVHTESGHGWRTALYPLTGAQADGLRADRHARILLAAALHDGVQNDRAASVAAFGALCDLILAGPGTALSERLEALDGGRGRVRTALCHAYVLPPGGEGFARDWFDVPAAAEPSTGIGHP